MRKILTQNLAISAQPTLILYQLNSGIMKTATKMLTMLSSYLGPGTHQMRATWTMPSKAIKITATLKILIMLIYLKLTSASELVTDGVLFTSFASLWHSAWQSLRAVLRQVPGNTALSWQEVSYSGWHSASILPQSSSRLYSVSMELEFCLRIV